MAAHQAPLSLGVSRQEYWSGLPGPSPMHSCMLSHFSCVQLCTTLWIAAHQAPLSTGFSRQEYWSGLPFPSPINWLYSNINYKVKKKIISTFRLWIFFFLQSTYASARNQFQTGQGKAGHSHSRIPTVYCFNAYCSNHFYICCLMYGILLFLNEVLPKLC